jgi:translation initiation factor 3 subunit C
VTAIIDKVQKYVERQGTPPELCRIYLRKVEHLYYKLDNKVLEKKEVIIQIHSAMHVTLN